MGSLTYWTIVAVLYQTTLSLILGILILRCHLSPCESELHEVTLIKLLYLYDPEACDRVYFYNYTRKTHRPRIVWTVSNPVASSFRNKVRVWISLHVIWTLLGVAYYSQDQKPIGFYAALLPFTMTGIAILLMDVAFTIQFLMDAAQTGTEEDIFNFINKGGGAVLTVNKTKIFQPLRPNIFSPPVLEDDTSWIALLFAFISCRAVVQWFLNFWLIKDNYYDGVDYYRRLLKIKEIQNEHIRAKLSLSF